jgi:NDP-sugar pyrophosphorylase family protein
MVSVLDRPLIEHTITRLKKSGMADIILAGSLGSHSSIYKEFLSSGDASRLLAGKRKE